MRTLFGGGREPVQSLWPVRRGEGEPLQPVWSVQSLQPVQSLRSELTTEADLEAKAEALATMSEVMRVLAKSGTNLVGEVLRASGAADGFEVWGHLPPGDAQDAGTGAQWYYHAHPPTEDGDGPHDGEHGHFHLFVRHGEDRGAITHLCGVAMTPEGTPTQLFTTNRWVTGEDWLPAEQTAALLDRFEVDSIHPSWPVNLWLGALVRLYAEEIAAMLRLRDAAVEARGGPTDDVLEDRGFEVAATCAVDLVGKADALGL